MKVMAPQSLGTAKRGVLLERSEQLSVLAEQLAAVSATSHGRLVLVGGEAGAGNTALVRRFADELPRTTRVLSGACDALYTPRPLGPFLDVAEATGGELRRLAEVGVRPHEFAAGPIREISATGPAVLLLAEV